MSRPTWAFQLVMISDRGWKAFEEGKRREDCPYKWAKAGFARQRYDYWHKGFDLAAQVAADQRIFDKARAGVPGYGPGNPR